MSANPAQVTQEPLLLRDDRNEVTVLTLNRPRQFNALSFALLSELAEALDDIAKDQRARVVVIAGAGPAFCAGHDLKEMRGNRDREFLRNLFQLCTSVFLKIARIPQPVIAKVHGIATAAGCQMVAACDLAVASAQAKFATSGINVGLFCSTPGVALARNVHRKQAMEMLLTGEFIDAKTALARGLVNRVVEAEELESETGSLACVIASKPAATIAAGKRAFYRQVEKGAEEAYTIACDALLDNILSSEAEEGLDAFSERRPPKWK
ncbi:MAG: enoyl-CoA hydratase [Burkholderiales bacterium]